MQCLYTQDDIVCGVSVLMGSSFVKPKPILIHVIISYAIYPHYLQLGMITGVEAFHRFTPQLLDL